MRGWRLWLSFVAVSLVLTGAMRAQRASVAPSPPMGWNSWDSYGLTIDEAQFRDNVRVLAERLKPFGWSYAVIDEGWYFENPQDRPHPEKLFYVLDLHGRYVPDGLRFPSANPRAPGRISPQVIASNALIGGNDEGFKPLGDWVHSQGLKFGIHIVRGVPRASMDHKLKIDGTETLVDEAADRSDACPWDPTNWGVKDNAAGQAWYDSLIRQYAGWGLDFLKVDCIADHPYRVSEIRQIRRAIDKVGRPMVLSLSPGPMAVAHADEVASLAEMWRISDDVWDVWEPEPGKKWPRSVMGQFENFAAWAKYAKPGNWPDGDMLPLGEIAPKPDVGSARRSRLTRDEQQTQMTLWAIARSPLILGANLTMLDGETMRLLTNRDVIRVNQTAVESHEVKRNGNLVVWQAMLPKGEVALALFNLGDEATTVQQPMVALGDKLPARQWKARDAWGHSEVNDLMQLHVRLPAHGSAMYLLH